MDITLCKGEGCPIKEKCKRFTAQADPLYQSFFIEVPGKWIDMPDLDINKSRVWKCDMYWGIHQESIFETLKKAVGL